MAPRAYVITPVNANAITTVWSYFKGGVDFNGAVPIAEATGTYSIPVVSYYHAFDFFGRSANVTAASAYGVGKFEGEVLGSEESIYRSGLLDFTARLSVNLYGGKAMRLPEFMKWNQKTLIGASIKVVAPTGQYDPARLVNWSINRWAFKPEVGVSRRRGQWILDGYAGVWLYSTNRQFGFGLPVPKPQVEAPIGSLEGHLSYDFKKLGLWASLDGNYWWGGQTTVDGIPNPVTKQTSSRLGATASIPIARHQSIKISYSGGTYVRFGGDYHNLQLAWQYSWIGKRW
jgi:hypothetical protein